jgi:hypothetical protein
MGGWYIGREFSRVGGAARSNIAHIRSDGRLDPAFDPGADGRVTALARSGGTVYVGGLFRHIGGSQRQFLAAVRATDGRATEWKATVGSVDRPRCGGEPCDRQPDPVSALLVSPQGVYVGGAFNSIAGRRRHRIARLNAATGHATGWNPSANRQVLALARSGSTIYAGGDFDRIGGRRRPYLAALEGSSGHATGWRPNADFDVAALATSGRTVYAGGDFERIGGKRRDSLAALDAITGAATDWAPSPDDGVTALAVSGRDVYVGGYFGTIGTRRRDNLACISATSGVATAWSPNPNSSVLALAVSPSSVYAGGPFTSIGGQPRNRLAALDATTGKLTGWNPDVGTLRPGYPNVYALAGSGSAVYAGGVFTSVGGQPRRNLAALDPTTGAATDWTPNPDGMGVFALAVSGQTVYAGGRFESIGGRRRHTIAALDATTGAATDWNPNPIGGYYAGSILTLALAGSSVYAGGNFAFIGGQPRHNLAALDATTGAATDWNPDPTGGTFVHQNDILLGETDALATSAGNVYVGGDFTTIAGQPRNHLAAVDATTGTATDWNPNPTRADQASSAVRIDAVAVADSTVYVGGEFTSVGGQPRGGLAALDASTGAATDWNPNGRKSAPTSTGASALAVSGSTLYAGGGFASVGTVAQQVFAEFTDH